MYILNQIWFGKFHYFGFKVKNLWGGGIFSLKKLKYHFAKYYYLSIKYHKTSIKIIWYHYKIWFKRLYIRFLHTEYKQKVRIFIGKEIMQHYKINFQYIYFLFELAKPGI